MQKEMYSDAIEAHQHILSINPNSWDAHCNLGNLLKHTGDRAGAKRCFTQV